MRLPSILLQIPAPAPGRNLLLILVPVVLGLIAVYLLLPRPRGTRPLWGTLSAGIAILLAGWLLVRSGSGWVETVLFYALSAIAVLAGGLLITLRNPVRAALSFALVVLSTCGLFLLQAAPFLMAATIIIYAGAIVVTFLFVIMLAQQVGTSDADQRSREPFLSSLAGFVLLGAMLCMLHLTYSTERFDALLARAKVATESPTLEEMRNTLGSGNDFFDALHREAQHAHIAPDKTKAFEDSLSALEENWNPPSWDADKMRSALRKLYEEGVAIRNSYGNLQPPRESSFLPPGIDNKKQPLELSTYGRLHSDQPSTQPLRDARGRSVLPAENVAYLGRTLFSDYLLAVELGGTLLLVATVGAIAIAGRRPEGLR
jgi:NADH:ubiquinone oxidoreductase subunit 6 (subunit J)